MLLTREKIVEVLNEKKQRERNNWQFEKDYFYPYVSVGEPSYYFSLQEAEAIAASYVYLRAMDKKFTLILRDYENLIEEEKKEEGKTISIYEAVKILNENKYLYKHHLFGHDMDVVWVINERTGHEPNVLLRESGMWLGRKSIDQFTAIAVAEKYLRDK